MTIAPALRYTRWAADGALAGSPRSRPDQAELVVAVTSGSRSFSRPLGQHVSGGVVVGTALTDGTPAQSFNFIAGESSFGQSSAPVRSVIAGAMVELAMPANFSIEADALYRPLRSENVSFLNGTKASSFESSAATWEIPILAKYRFPVGIFQPLVEIGPSFRLAGGGSQNQGITAGGGVQTQLRALKIVPEIRFTHWTGGNAAGVDRAAPNQVEVLVGFFL